MYYFASDIHLGLGSREESRRREKLFADWLVKVSEDAEAIFLVGDIFDFWFEYNRVVPKGFTRLLGTLSSLTDKGTKIYFFVGNHDMWMRDYLKEECGVCIHLKGEEFELYGKRVYISHGDEICARASKSKSIINTIFRSGITRWLLSHFAHPNFTLRFGQSWSAKSRKAGGFENKFTPENETLITFANNKSNNESIDYFVFGHSHFSGKHELNSRAEIVFLGEWLENPTYVTLNKEGNIAIHDVN